MTSVYDGFETGEDEQTVSRPFTKEDRRKLHWYMEAVFLIMDYDCEERLYCQSVARRMNDLEKHALLVGYRADFEHLKAVELFMHADAENNIVPVAAEDYVNRQLGLQPHNSILLHVRPRGA